MFERRLLTPEAISRSYLSTAIAILVTCWAGLAPAFAVERGDPIQDNLYGVSFANEHLGWACGSFGTVAHTADGGKTWKLQETGASEPLYSIDFVDERLGWAVGRSGTILHTGDGGANWQTQKAPDAKHLFSVDFLDATFGVAVGDWGLVLVTEDGGQTWTNRSLPEDVILNDVAVIDRQRALIVGEIGSIYRTEDAGKTWTQLNSGIDKTLFGIHCLDVQTCWVVGIDALILTTTDGGGVWEVRNGSVEMRPLEQVGFGQAFENPSLYAIDVVGSFGVAAGEIGSVFVSRDAGVTWQRLEASKNWALPWFRDLALVGAERGAIVGARGRRVMIREGRIEADGQGE